MIISLNILVMHDVMFYSLSRIKGAVHQVRASSLKMCILPDGP